MDHQSSVRRLGFLLVVLVMARFPGPRPCHAEPAAADAPQFTTHATPAAALLAVLAQAQEARVLAFGEIHEVKGAAKVASALRHFTEELLPVIRERTSDVVVETWITEGTCGKKETAVVKDVQTTTKRPETTESELVTMIKRVKAEGIQPHILKVSCDEYQSLLGDKGEVDYEKLLALITDLQHKLARSLLAAPRSAGKSVALYSGALHNDLFPLPELSRYTFGPDLARETAGKYLEIDLYVPEFMEGNQTVTKEPWYSLYRQQFHPSNDPKGRKGSKPAGTLLVRRSETSYVIVFPWDVLAAKGVHPPKVSPPR